MRRCVIVRIIVTIVLDPKRTFLRVEASVKVAHQSERSRVIIYISRDQNIKIGSPVAYGDECKRYKLKCQSK